MTEPRRARHLQRTHARDMLYHRVLAALGEQGCPICALGSEAVQRYLDSLLYERVNDPSLRQTLTRSRGFCREHAGSLVRAGDSLGIAILYRNQVEEALRDVQQAAYALGTGRRRGLWRGDGAHDGSPATTLRRSRTPEALCPACRIAEEAETRHLATLVQHLDDPEIRAAIVHSAFLCLPHLVTALERTRTRDQAQTLLGVAEAKLAHLRTELDELIRKRDYQFLHEPRGEEQTAWFRAVLQLVGWWRQGSPRGRSGRAEAP